jgi:hypothetical protein
MPDHIQDCGVGGATGVDEEAGIEVHHNYTALHRKTLKG